MDIGGLCYITLLNQKGETKQMKSIRCPCIDCIVDAGCSYICDDMIEFVSFFIESKDKEIVKMYISNERVRSLLMDLNNYHHKVANVMVLRHRQFPGVVTFNVMGDKNQSSYLIRRYRHGRFTRKEFR
jgi:hypothetical protein